MYFNNNIKISLDIIFKIKQGKFMTNKIAFLSLVTSTLFLASCGSTSTPSVTAIVQINNTTTTDLYQLYIKNSDTSSWGNDLLTSDTYIRGRSKVNFETSKCNRLIDVKVTGHYGSPIYISEQNQLNCGKTIKIKIVD